MAFLLVRELRDRRISTGQTGGFEYLVHWQKTGLAIAGCTNRSVFGHVGICTTRLECQACTLSEETDIGNFTESNPSTSRTRRVVRKYSALVRVQLSRKKAHPKPNLGFRLD